MLYSFLSKFLIRQDGGPFSSFHEMFPHGSLLHTLSGYYRVNHASLSHFRMFPVSDCTLPMHIMQSNSQTKIKPTNWDSLTTQYEKEPSGYFTWCPPPPPQFLQELNTYEGVGPTNQCRGFPRVVALWIPSKINCYEWANIFLIGNCEGDFDWQLQRWRWR